MELALLLEDPSDVEDPSFSLWDDRLVLRPRRKRKQITDIVAWVQAFGIYTLVMCSYFPHRAPDLTRYNLLILRTSQQFPGSSCLAYDRACPREAAARLLLDWSRINSDLFNFHTATAATSTQPSRALNQVLTRGGRFGRPAARRPRRFVDRGMPVGVPAPTSCVGSAILVTFRAAPPCTVVRWSTRLVRSEPPGASLLSPHKNLGSVRGKNGRNVFDSRRIFGGHCSHRICWAS